jgi:hypothetical protein
MKYFAIYLPVEGEIEKGDIIPYMVNILTYAKFLWWGVEDTKYKWCIIENDGGYQYQYAAPKDIKKVKLFLCTRDIQVGDRVLHIPSNKEVDVKYESVLNSIKEKNQLSNYVKVIGKVSEDAIWVKEGMGFEEVQVAWMEWDKRFPEDEPYYINIKEKPRKNKNYKSYVVIECPTCKNFH